MPTYDGRICRRAKGMITVSHRRLIFARHEAVGEGPSVYCRYHQRRFKSQDRRALLHCEGRARSRVRQLVNASTAEVC
jgi:hypothetical protein